MKLSPQESRKQRNAELVAVELDKDILKVLEDKIEKLGITKRKYLNDLILKDLGYVFVPAKVIPSKYVPVEQETTDIIEKDEESV